MLEPAAIGRRLGELLPPSGQDPADGGLGENADPVNVFSFLARLRHLTGIDFSQYKAATVRRQLQRRMTICQKPSIEEYLKLLETDSRESLALVKNLLVSVTAFFRDPAMFAALAEKLGHYVNEWPGRYRLRVWVPGCATGEEAYSLGMLISEVLGHPMNLADHLKIFATDLDEESLAVARRATYPAVDAEAIPEGLRTRFVSFVDGELTINESLRRCLVFALHNIAEDPPFPRLDLISCRNTLIYFNPPLQRRTLVMFHTGLVPGGLLFLGPSESPRLNPAGFTALDGAHNIFQRTSEPQPVAIASRALSALSAPSVPGQASRPAAPPDTLPEEHTATLEALVRSSCPACVVVDDNHELVEVIGEVAPYCRLPEGQISTAATAFLLPELQLEARALVLLVRAEGQPVRSRPLLLKESGLLLRLEARPLRVRDRQFTVLSFLPERDAPEENAGSDDVRERDNDFEREISRMENDLLSSQESQRSSMAQLEAANQELEASAEELQAFSEELQSANEELQASNLELVSLNHQLRIRSEQLQAFTSDLENIQNSLTQGMVIVDQAANVNRYTPLAVRVFGLVEADIGRPLLGCPTTIPLPGLKEALREVLSGSPRRVIEAVNDETAYLVQVLPYREQDGQQRGAIISLTDVSELREMRQAAEASLGEFASSLTDTLEQAVWKRDISLHRLLYASLRVLPLTGWSPAELCAQPQLLDEAIDPDDRERVWSARDPQRPGWTVSFRLITRDGRRRWLTETAKVIDDGRERSVVGTLSDVTDQRESEEEARRLSDLLETLISSPGLVLAVLDTDRRVVLVNETLCGLLGFERDSLLGSPASLFCVLPPLPKLVPEEQQAASGPPLNTTLPLLHRDWPHPAPPRADLAAAAGWGFADPDADPSATDASALIGPQQGPQASRQGLQRRAVGGAGASQPGGAIHPDRMAALPEQGLLLPLPPGQGEVELRTAAVDLQLQVLRRQPFALGAAGLQPQAEIGAVSPLGSHHRMAQGFAAEVGRRRHQLAQVGVGAADGGLRRRHRSPSPPG